MFRPGRGCVSGRKSIVPLLVRVEAVVVLGVEVSGSVTRAAATGDPRRSAQTCSVRLRTRWKAATSSSAQGQS